ncbi:MAG TPA: hypothetical protein PLZ51_11990, partial [Aggregatilineales bacterium]|nr:hypothetical protein [Aggregatilineales bacterium]
KRQQAYNAIFLYDKNRLLALKSDAIEPMIEMLLFDDKYIKLFVADVLAEMGWAQDATQHARLAVARQDWKTAEDLGVPAVEVLLEALYSSDAKIWLGAIRALAKIGDARATQPIIEKLSDLYAL